MKFKKHKCNNKNDSKVSANSKYTELFDFKTLKKKVFLELNYNHANYHYRYQ